MSSRVSSSLAPGGPLSSLRAALDPKRGVGSGGRGCGDCWLSKTGERTDEGGVPAATVAAAGGLSVVTCVEWTRNTGAGRVWGPHREAWNRENSKSVFEP